MYDRQEVEFLRKYVSRRLSALSEEEIAADFDAADRSGGAEALATFHQLLSGEWMTGALTGPLARVNDGPWSSADGRGRLRMAWSSTDGRVLPLESFTDGGGEPHQIQGGGDVRLYIKVAVIAASLRVVHG